MVSITLDQFHNLKPPAPTWKYLVYLPNNIPETNRIEPVYVENGTFTFPTVDSDARFNSGSYEYFPQFNNIDAIDITFIETEDYDITNFMYKWFGLVVHEDDGTYGIASEFKRQIRVVLLNEQGTEKANITYNGAFPTRRSTLNLGSEDNFVRVEQNFSVDSSTFFRYNINS